MAFKNAIIILLAATIGILDYTVDNIFGVDAYTSAQRFSWVRNKNLDVFSSTVLRAYSSSDNKIIHRQPTLNTNDVHGGKSKGRIYVEKRANKPKENKVSKKLSDFFATTIPGMEKVLAKEIQTLSDVEINSIVIGKSGVHFRGTKVITYVIQYPSVTLIKYS